MVNGESAAIPINSPIVYSSKNKDDVGNVSGATAGELAKQIVDTIKQAFEPATPDSPEFDLKLSWQGTACDRQYQAKEFGNTLHEVLKTSRT